MRLAVPTEGAGDRYRTLHHSHRSMSGTLRVAPSLRDAVSAASQALVTWSRGDNVIQRRVVNSYGPRVLLFEVVPAVTPQARVAGLPLLLRLPGGSAGQSSFLSDGEAVIIDIELPNSSVGCKERIELVIVGVPTGLI